MYPNGSEQDKWSTSTKKYHRKGYPPKYSTEASKSYALHTTNQYEHLHNLQDTSMQRDTLRTQGNENTSYTNNYDHHTQLHHQRRKRTQRVVKTKKEDPQTYHIPTLINGTEINKILKTVSSEMTCRNNVTKNKLSQHTVSMIGDSFLRGIRDNVDLSLSNKFSTYSMVKPGGDLKTILDSAKYAADSLTLEDVIVICGGSNDFNPEKAEPTTDHIRGFVKTYIRTNIVLTEVPARYDLSYYSHINKGIRSFNRKLLEIAAENKQLTLLEIGMDRKYHTRHGLHFNKPGKLLFSNRITEAIYSILNKKTKQRVETKEKLEIRGDVIKKRQELQPRKRRTQQLREDNKISPT
jgi:hypothetical protein